MARTTSFVIHADEHRMGPLTIRQPLPSAVLPDLDPFVLLHHAPPATMDGQNGVSAHPHRGFSPVTFMFKGSVRHRDSRGNDSTVGAWGTQWMHAGSGILHEEIPLAGEIELIQLWVNTPAARKLDAPAYFPLSPEETPRHRSADGLVTVNVIAGSTLGLVGPITPITPVLATTIDARRGGRLFVPVPPGHSAFLYVLAGSLRFGDVTVDRHHMVVFNRDGDGIDIDVAEDTRALLMSGEPIGEPIVSYGPFVMNTQDEIRAAYRDYKAGAMGAIAG